MNCTLSRRVLLLLLAGTCSCSDWFGGSSSGGGPSPFTLRSSRFGVPSDARIVIRGNWLIFFASEATTGNESTDLNGDGDFDDSIATVVDMLTVRERGLGVAATHAEVLGQELFFAVDEDQDRRDWNLDGVNDDLVLLHWNTTSETLVFVSTLNPIGADPFFVVGDRLYYCDVPETPLNAPNTALTFVTEAAPQTQQRILNSDLANSLSPALHTLDEGLMFLTLDETTEGRDLDFDGDTTDEFVLALFDTTSPGAFVRVLGLPIASEEAPVRALNTAAGDWLIGVLVNEDAFGETNLNDPALFDPAWQPAACVGLEDADTDDDVLFFLNHAAWIANPFLNAPVNTGLVGSEHVLVVRTSPLSPGYVATVSSEDDEGACALNDDEDADDLVVRWVLAQAPVLPFTDPDELLAISEVPGGTRGATDFASRFVIAVDEAADGRDHDGFEDEDVVILAKLDPSSANPRWIFDQSAGSDFFVGPTWMRKTDEGDRLLVAMSEAVLRLPLNAGDSDLADAVPTFGVADPLESGDIDFPGPPVAVVADEPGIVIGGPIALFRVSEPFDDRDWNRDGNKSDVVLLAARLDDLERVRFVATLMNNPGDGSPPLLVTAGGNTGAIGAAFVASEAGENRDFNADGDSDDFVVRWFRFFELP